LSDLTPNLAFAYATIALAGIPLASLFTVPNAMVADLTDLDEKLTGMRREAIYFGTQGLFLKIDLGLSTLVMTIMFSVFGKSIQNPLGIRMTGLLGSLFAIIGIIAFLKFPKDLNAYASKHPEMYKYEVKTV
jgi:GPH family glycoside/pentoside/hexuronide:cation symporter